MANTNPVFNQFKESLTKVVSIGIGSTIITACRQCGLNAEKLEKKDIPVLKNALAKQFKKYYARKESEVKNVLNNI